MTARVKGLNLMLAVAFVAGVAGCGDSTPTKPTGAPPAATKGKDVGAGGLKENPRQ